MRKFLKFFSKDKDSDSSAKLFPTLSPLFPSAPLGFPRRFIENTASDLVLNGCVNFRSLFAIGLELFGVGSNSSKNVAGSAKNKSGAQDFYWTNASWNAIIEGVIKPRISHVTENGGSNLKGNSSRNKESRKRNEIISWRKPKKRDLEKLLLLCDKSDIDDGTAESNSKSTRNPMQDLVRLTADELRGAVQISCKLNNGAAPKLDTLDSIVTLIQKLGCGNVRSLDLSAASLTTELRPLKPALSSTLGKLRSLNLSRNQLRDVTKIFSNDVLEQGTAFVSLEDLDLSDNHITDIAFLPRLTSLRRCDLGKKEDDM
jgi:hypothetical protein